MAQMTAVGMGEGYVEWRDGSVLVALGLGSCVAICILDPVVRVGAMAHALLPSTTGQTNTPYRFAETAVPALIAAMEAQGALRSRMQVAVAGGAQMFGSAGSSPILDIGARNAVAARQALTAARLPLLAEDVGGHTGRSVYFHIDTGRLVVRTIGQGERDLVVLGARRPVAVPAGAQRPATGGPGR